MSGIEDRRNDNREEPESVLDVIQRKHSISLLKYLDERGEVMVSDVQRDITRGRNLDEMLDDYERLGIIRRRYAKPQRKPQRIATLLRSRRSDRHSSACSEPRTDASASRYAWTRTSTSTLTNGRHPRSSTRTSDPRES